jgi:hypothetical protein
VTACGLLGVMGSPMWIGIGGMVTDSGSVACTVVRLSSASAYRLSDVRGSSDNSHKYVIC